MSTRAASLHEPKTRLSEDAFETVRQWILSGEMSADSVLSERELAARLGLSRTPLREAVGRLVGEGLLRRSGRVIVVNAVRTEDVFEILSLRRLLEGEAVKLAIPRIGKEALLKLRNSELGLLALSTITSEEHWQVDDTFHDTIAQASGNRLLARTVMELRERTRLYGLQRIPQRFEPGRQEHMAVLDAMQSGDAELASARMQAHLQSVADAIMQSFGSSRGLSAHG